MPHGATPARRAAQAGSAVHDLTHASLVEHLARAAITELVIVEHERGSFHLEAVMPLRSGRSRLVTARGEARSFRALETVVSLLRTVGVGVTVIRLEILP
jgi:hypothetical protein